MKRIGNVIVRIVGAGLIIRAIKVILIDGI